MTLKFYTLKKILFVFILLTGISQAINAQNVTVNSTGGTSSASYSTLGNAFSAINSGTHTGTITVSITANTSEASGGAVLNASGSGSASYTSIAITPSGARTVSTAVTAGSPLINLNGADNVKIDGLNTGGNSLTISNTTASATSGTSTIMFIGGATSNKITNCTILGSFSAAVGTNGGNIFFSTDANTANGNDNDTISFNNIGPAGTNLSTKGIYMNGSATTTAINNSGNLITNNNIYDYFGAAVTSAGVYISTGNTDNNFTNNKFYQTASRTQTTGAQHSGIWIANTSGNNFLVSGNTIGFAASNGTGTYTFVGVSSSSLLIPIFLNVGTTTSTSVQGNTIAGIAISGACSGTSTSAPFRGVYVSSGLTNIGDVTGNTIGSQSATGSITYTSSSTSTSDVIGMYNFGSSNWIANNNKIGGITVANSSTGSSNIYGLRVNTSSSVTTSMLNNTIGGTVSNSIQSTTTASGSIVVGIFLSTSIATVTGDTIRNLTAAGGTGTISAASVMGICFVSSSVNNTCSQNIIHSLSNTNSSAITTITGIQYTSSTGTNLIARNFIHSLNSASTSGIINGIQVSAGTATYQNNMIRLGIDASGSSVTTACAIKGVNEISGINNFYFNSIYIGGTGVGTTASNSFAFSSAVVTSTRIYRNNIFQNSRSNTSTGGKHYAVNVAGTAANPTGLTINNNLYYANGTGGVFGFFNSADVASLSAWQTAVGQDAGSYSSDPQFLTPSGTSSTVDLHINASIATLVEATGANISGITDDYDGQTRSGLTPEDIGADAGNFTASSNMSFVSSTTTQANTSSVSTNATDQQVIGIEIVTSGASNPLNATSFTVNTTGTTNVADITNAKIFYTGTSSTFAASGQFGSTVSSPTGSYSITGTQALSQGTNYFWLTYSIPCGATTGNVIDAQCTSLTVVSAQTPTVQNPSGTRTIVTGPLTGTKTVGTGGDYASLTAAAAAVNSLGLSGNTTLSILNSLTESGAVTFNQWVECGTGGYTLTIKPAASTTPTISASTTTAVIILNGADRVTIDGSNNGSTSQNMTITNTNSTSANAVISIVSLGTGTGAVYNTIKNCILTNQISTSTNYCIAAGGSTIGTSGADNDNLTIQNNSIGACGVGIFASGTASTSTGGNDTLNATQNTITISGSTLALIGIRVSNCLNSSIGRNTISLSTSVPGSPTAISLEAGFVSSTVTRNTITTVTTSSTAGYGGRGITVGTGTASSSLTISNNVIYGVNGSNFSGFGNSSAMGIAIGIVGNSSTLTTTAGGINLYYNAINMYGTYSYATNCLTTALYIGSGASALDIRNNVLVNSLNNTNSSGTSSKNYSIYSAAANTAFTSLNYNDYYVSGSQGVLSFLGADATTLSALQTAFGGNANSITSDPLFNSSTLLAPQTGSGVLAAGTFISGVTSDYTGTTRSGSTPSIGAYENAGDFTAPVISYTAISNTSSTSNISLSSFATITDVGSGVNTTSGTKPRLYYKKSTDNNTFGANTSGTNGWKFVEASNTTSPFSFTIDNSIINGGSVSAGNVINYFVAAQDLAGTPNVTSNPSTGFSATSVSSISAAPTTPNSYTIVAALATSLNVGTAQTYTSLTGTGGLFEAINNAILSGNTTVSVTSDITEDGTNALSNSGLGGYTLTIIPSAASTRVISNSTTLSQAMIRLDGAIGVTFDGRSGGSGQYLRIVNTHTTAASGMPAIQVLGGATSNTIRNCIIETNTSSTTQATILMETGTNSLTLKANDIRDAQGTPGTAGIPYAGVYSNTSTNTLTIGGSTAADGNNIYNFTNFGLNLTSIADAALVQYNSFYQSSARSTILINVNIASGSTHTVSNNNIYQTSGTNTAAYTGINIIGGGSGHTVNNNSIGGSNASRSGSALTLNVGSNSHGIFLTVGTASATNVQGNYFSNIGNITTSSSGSVFAINASAGNINIGTTAGNIIGGGASAYDTVLNAYDNGMINYSGTGNVDIENNTIGNTAYYRNAGDRNAGISITGSCQAIIKNNTINNIKGNATSAFPTSFSPMGIFISGAITSGSNIERNTISNIYNTSTGTAAYQSSGLYISGAAASGTTVKSNKIYNIKADGTGAGTLSPQVTGIYLASSSSIVFSNNQISIGTGAGNESRVFGIYDGSTGTNKYYYNSIYTSGSISTGSNNSFCHYRSSTSITTLRNNLLYNERTGGTGANFPIAEVISSNFGSDYNLFVSRDTSKVGNYTNTNYNFTNWKSYSGGDASSWSALYTQVNSDSLFTDKSNGDLSIKTNQTQAWYANGKGIAGTSSGSIATDFGGGARSTTYGFGTDIGANEFVPTSKPALAIQTGTIANNDSTTYTFGGRVIARIKWRNAVGSTTTFPSTMSAYYYSGTPPPDPTNAGAYSTSKYMNGFWLISPTGGVHFLYDITLLYDEAMLGTLPSESSIKLGKKPALTGTGDWKVHYGSTVNTTLNTVSFTSLNEFSVFALSDNASPLPIKLVSFNAAVSNENALLTWQSSNEFNSSHYNILRSFDGTNFDKIGVEKSTGSQFVSTNYSFVDANAAKLYNGKHIYYRLEMVDMDGSAEFSEIRPLYFKDGLQANTITPQFIDNNLNIKLNLSDDSKLTISLLDLNGKLLLNSTNQYAKGISISSINTTEIATGLYLVKVENAGEVMITKVFKN